MILNFPDSAKALHKYISNKLLENVYPEEADSIAKILIAEIIRISRTDIILDKKVSVSPKQQKELEMAVIRVLNNEPVQYILKKAHFYARDYYVDRSVLIPRPETEELVEWIKMTCSNPKGILDIGTGSGCIAISLAKIFPEADVLALDLEEKALEVAETNAKNLKANVKFMHHDILKMEKLPGEFDVVVSNPPYVPNADKMNMKDNVLNNEPASALFVSDNDPLVFYRHIATLAEKDLKEGGNLFFEIHEERGDEMTALLMHHNFKNIALKKDMQDKDRMIKGNK